MYILECLSEIPSKYWEIAMPIDIKDVTEKLRRIVLTGRLDIPGTEEIAMRFAEAATSAGRRVVVDLTAVSFLGSFGIRALISNAKAAQSKGGRMVLFVGGNETVTKTLQTTGIDVLIPMFADATKAEQAALN
jgi:anti-anti-sigma factor